MKGDDNPSRKLCEKQVREIKKMINDGYAIGFIAREYEVHRKTIGRIKSGENWKHIEE